MKTKMNDTADPAVSADEYRDCIKLLADDIQDVRFLQQIYSIMRRQLMK